MMKIDSFYPFVKRFDHFDRKKNPMTLPSPQKLFLLLSEPGQKKSHIKVKTGQIVAQYELLAIPNEKGSSYIYSPLAGEIEEIRKIELPTGETTEEIVLKVGGYFSNFPPQKNNTWNLLSPTELREKIQKSGLTTEDGYDLFTYLEGSASKKIVIRGFEKEFSYNLNLFLLENCNEDLEKGFEILLKAWGSEQEFFFVSESKGKNLSRLLKRLQKKSFSLKLLTTPHTYLKNNSIVFAKKFFQTSLNAQDRSEDPVKFIDLSTLFYLFQFIFNERPFTEKLIFLSGANLPATLTQGVYRVFLGNSLQNFEFPSKTRIILNRLLSSYAFQNTSFSFSKSMHTLFFLGKEEMQRTQTESCIRCGLCVQNCPVGLNPIKIYEQVRLKNFNSQLMTELKNCIECGLCSFVCPSQIPLSEIIFLEKEKLMLRESDKESTKRPKENQNAPLKIPSSIEII